MIRTLTAQEMDRAAYELVSCAILDGMQSPEYRAITEVPLRQIAIWESVADAVRQSNLPLAYLLRAVFECTNTQLRPGDGSKDVKAA